MDAVHNFIMYASYRPMIEALPAEDVKSVILALYDFLDGNSSPTLSATANIAFISMSGWVAKDIAKYNDKCEKNKANIRKRWANHNTKENNSIQSYTTVTDEYDRIPPNSTNTNDIDTDTEKRKTKRDNSNISSPKFTPPTVEQVAEYCKLKNIDIDAEYFIDYYQARGWQFSNGQTMKDWKASIRTWKNLNARYERAKPQTTQSDDDVDMDAICIQQTQARLEQYRREEHHNDFR